PGLGDQVRRAHRPLSFSGTQTEIAAGLTLNLSRFVFGRSPPSSSYGDLASSSTTIFLAVVVLTNGEDAVRPTAVFPRTRAQSTSPSAVTTPTSRRPSSGGASGNAAMPPMTSPMLPTSTQLAGPLNQRRPSTSTRARTASRP